MDLEPRTNLHLKKQLAQMQDFLQDVGVIATASGFYGDSPEPVDHQPKLSKVITRQVSIRSMPMCWGCNKSRLWTKGLACIPRVDSGHAALPSFSCDCKLSNWLLTVSKSQRIPSFGIESDSAIQTRRTSIISLPITWGREMPNSYPKTKCSIPY